MKNFILIFSLVLFLSQNSFSKPLKQKDFLIVEILPSTLPLYDIKIEKDYDQTRYQVRQLHAFFIQKAKKYARFIILDFFYDDLGIEKIDNQLVEALKSFKNTAIALGGIYNDQYLLSHNKFLIASGYYGHIFYFKEENGILLYNQISSCIFENSPDDCSLFYDHITINVFKALKKPYFFPLMYFIPSETLIRFQRISYPSFNEKNKKNIKISQFFVFNLNYMVQYQLPCF